VAFDWPENDAQIRGAVGVFLKKWHSGRRGGARTRRQYVAYDLVSLLARAVVSQASVPIPRLLSGYELFQSALYLYANRREPNTGTVRRSAAHSDFSRPISFPTAQRRARQRKRNDAAGILRGDFASIS
jgi:hypothetical protein